MSKLLVVNDGKRERELLLVERLVVGRDPMCDLSHDDALLSRRHAEFQMIGDEVTVRDLGSRNGLFVNGNRAAERSLNPGDIVQIGPLRVRYVTTEAAVSLEPDELDIDITKVVPAPPSPRPAVAAPAPATIVESIVGFDEEPFDDGVEDEEEVTRVVHVDEVESILAAVDDPEAAEATMMVTAEEIGSGVYAAGFESSGSGFTSAADAGFDDAPTLHGPMPTTVMPQAAVPPPLTSRTIVLPPPGADVMRRPAAVAPVTAAPAPMALPSAVEVAPVATSGFSSFVFIQLAALATVVFVVSAAPLIMWRGDGTLIGQRSLANLLRWPVLPIIIGLATTYVVGTLVNRRFTETMVAVRDELLPPESDSGTPGDYRS